MAAVGAGVQIGTQVAMGLIQVIKAYNTYKEQNPQMTEDEALISFANGVSDFTVAVERWDNTEAPKPVT